jgi:hypothetical protein
MISPRNIPEGPAERYWRRAVRTVNLASGRLHLDGSDVREYVMRH